MPPTGIEWRKSSFSAETGNCVEVGTEAREPLRHVRDSQNQDSGIVTADPHEWLSFMVTARK